jgi:hypothetical protein
MKLERGVETKHLRLRLILQSEDVTAHSAMSDEVERFSTFADDVAEHARLALAKLLSEYPALPRIK